MTEPALLVEAHGPVTRLVMNRPQAMNALNLSMFDALKAELPRLAADDACRVLILTGSGPAFCAGADLKQALAGQPAHLGAFLQRLVAAHRGFSGGENRASDRFAGVVAAVGSDVTKHKVGDIVGFYTEILSTGRSSMKIMVEVWTEHDTSGVYTKLTEGLFTFVSLNDQGRTRALPDLR